MRIISKEEFDKIPSDYKGIFFNYQKDDPKQWCGRRTAFLPGEGTTLSVEGIHFLVEGDYNHLPILTKETAYEGACYIIAGGYIRVDKIYRITEKEAKRYDLVYLDRVEVTRYIKTDTGLVEMQTGFALAGGDTVEI